MEVEGAAERGMGAQRAEDAQYARCGTAMSQSGRGGVGCVMRRDGPGLWGQKARALVHVGTAADPVEKGVVGTSSGWTLFSNKSTSFHCLHSPIFIFYLLIGAQY
jgi:hypothetical protein